MNGLEELYGEMIISHSKNPNNFGTIPNASCKARGNNMICGDWLEVYLYVENGIVEKIKFEGGGCAVCIASASMMTSAVVGKTIDEVKEMLADFHEYMIGKREACFGCDSDLNALSGVRKFPIRVKCATLAWHALKECLGTCEHPDQ